MSNFNSSFFLVSLLAVFSLSCNESKQADNGVATSEKRTVQAAFVTNKPQIVDTAALDSANFATYYVVIADTGLTYQLLRTKMFDLSNRLKIDIDTMGRSFDAQKNLIALPKDDADELYAGEYFPRRSPGETLSLEYLENYKPSEDEKQIALVSGIFETEDQANAALLKLRRNYSTAFKVKSSLYIGCMH